MNRKSIVSEKYSIVVLNVKLCGCGDGFILLRRDAKV